MQQIKAQTDLTPYSALLLLQAAAVVAAKLLLVKMVALAAALLMQAHLVVQAQPGKAIMAVVVQQAARIRVPVVVALLPQAVTLLAALQVLAAMVQPRLFPARQ